jgi:hypothetical protein
MARARVGGMRETTIEHCGVSLTYNAVEDAQPIPDHDTHEELIAKLFPDATSAECRKLLIELYGWLQMTSSSVDLMARKLCEMRSIKETTTP